MAGSWCPPYTGGTADVYVSNAHLLFLDRGTEVYNRAMNDLAQLMPTWLQPVDFNIDFNTADPQATFNRPQRPDLDAGALEFRDPEIQIGPAPVFSPTSLQARAAPEVDVPAPSLTFGPRPDAPTIPLPVAPAPAEERAMPVMDSYVLPAVPTLEALSLPATPEITIAEATLERPTLIDPPFNQTWSFTPEPYTRVLVDQLVDTLRPMITGSAALPAAIEQALYERGLGRITRETQTQVDQAYSEFAARGFTEPTGMLNGRIIALRQQGQTAAAEASRDVMIRHFELMYEQQRFAITQGAALEGVLINLHIEEQRFLLEAAKFQMDAALAVVNYRVQVFNAQMQAYATEAQVARDRIQAQLAKIEIYRAQLEGLRVRGELNTQQVQLYEAQLRSIQTLVEIYKGKVDVVRVQADIDMQQIEKYKAELQAYNERWNAYVAEWRGYSASVEGESKRVDIFRSLVDMQAKRVDAWATGVNVDIERARLEQQAYGVQMQGWEAQITRLRAALAAEQARLGAVAASADAQARMYAADAQVEVSASAAADRTFELGLRRDEASLNAQLKRADMLIEQARFIQSQLTEIKKAKAQISSQLAASTMSAVNYSAGVSSSVSKGQSCSTSFNFNGEVGDA